jgi:hypothetical protein
MQGSIVKSQKISNKLIRVDVRDLSGGVYIVKLVSGTGVQIGQIIKQ